MATIFLTGFPGFLGSALIEHLLERYPAEVSLTCLVQEKFRPQAEAKVSQIAQRRPSAQARIQLVNGDITQPDLGLGEAYALLTAETLEIYHLAAVYALGVPRELALKVNVEGTRHMLAYATESPRLKRFQYVSTCYVSGKYSGPFHETDLEKGQSFNNYYEETKYLAEIEVQQHMAAGLPATIYRPSIVTGDSRTGKTQKYDGPYYIMQWILRQPSIAFVPVVGDTHRYEVNVVPSDFVVAAIAHLSGLERSVGRVYQLSDPQPPTVNEMLDILAEVTERNLIRVKIPRTLAKGALEHIKAVQQLMRIEPQAIEYFLHPTHYTCTHTLEDLADSDIQCPPFGSYAAELVAFMQQNPDISADAMV